MPPFPLDIRRHTPDLIRPLWDRVKGRNTQPHATVTHTTPANRPTGPAHPATWNTFVFVKWQKKAQPRYLDVTTQYAVNWGSSRDARSGGSIEYIYGNTQTHGCRMTVQNHVLRFDIRARGDRATMGGGRDMFLSGWKRIRQDGISIRRIKGNWLRGQDSTNFNSYINDRNVRGLSPEDAARNTWTGKIAAELGYTRIKITREVSTQVKVLFSKPRWPASGFSRQASHDQSHADFRR
jgi:hypothetical protein